MTRARFQVLFFLLFALAVAPARGIHTLARPAKPQATESWRKQRPPASPARPFKLPATKEIKLDNGLIILLFEDRRAPLVTIQAGIPLTPPGVMGPAALANHVALAESTVELMTEGAGGRTSSDMAREVESLGGRIVSSANEDFAEVSAVVVSANAHRMIDLFADVMLRPAFPQREVELYKSNRVELLTLQRQEPAFLAEEMFDKVVYGTHPYSLSVPTPRAVQTVTRSRIERFYKSNFTPEGSAIVIAGDFDSSKIETRLRELFSGWRKPAARRVSGPLQSKKPVARKIYLIDRPGSEQADFLMGGLAVKRTDPDYIALSVANAILGAGTASRLFLNLREQKGYTYDVYSAVSSLKEAGTFFGASQTRTEVTVKAIKEMLAEFDRIASQKVSEQELKDAQSFLAGQFALSLSTQGGVASRLLHALVIGLGPDYLEGYRARVDAVTSDRVLEVARKYISTSTAAIVVVGDRKLATDLRGIAPVELFNTDGRRLRSTTR
ncbi:MAG TPA: pitrilysin family protein [Blastocatellia bacterium]|nr:pitrilysin family protein [Blastocatellia bacterium]